VVIGEETLAGIHGGQRRRLAEFFEAREQRAYRADGALGLPEGGAAMGLIERIQGSDFRQTIELVFAQFADAHGEIVHAAEGAFGTGAQDGLPGLFAETAGNAEAEA
jgi:hypothetical protein